MPEPQDFNMKKHLPFIILTKRYVGNKYEFDKNNIN